MNANLIPDDASIPGLPPVFRLILKALSALEYGSVEITVHDGRIVQVERREKIRPDEEGHKSKGPKS